MFTAHYSPFITGILFLLQTSIITGQPNQRWTSFRQDFKLDLFQAMWISCINRNNSKLQLCKWTLTLKKSLFISSILKLSQLLCCYSSHQLWCCMQMSLCSRMTDKNIKRSHALLLLFQKNSMLSLSLAESHVIFPQVGQKGNELGKKDSRESRTV